MIESLLFIITLFKDIVKSFFAFATKKYIFRPFRPDKRGKRRPFTRGAFCASVSENGYGSEAAGIKAAAALQSGEGFGSAKDAERCILRKIRHFSRHVRPRLPKRRTLSKRQRPLLPFAQAAARRPRRLFCRKTFVHRLARRLSAVLRVGGHASAARDGFTSAHEKIGKSGVLYVDGPRRKPSGRRKRKSAKSRQCEAGRPAGELPSGGGMPSDGECRPKTLFEGPTRQAAGGRRILSKYAG